MADEFNFDDNDDNESGDEWLATFADMATLLLTFFILLFSMSTIDKQRFQESFSSVREAFGGAQMKNVDAEDAEISKNSSGMQSDIQNRKEMIEAQRSTFNELRSFIAQSILQDAVRATFDDGTITLSIPSDVLFEPGSESLNPEAEPYVRAIRDLLVKQRQQNINIKGYTDNSAIPDGARFKDNWELSSLRAVNVLRDLLHGGIEPVRLTATGLADLEPIAPNTTEENRRKNRRVEFVLERRVGKTQ